MKRFHLVLLPCILVVVFAGLLPQSTLAQRISPASCGSWSVVSSPNRTRDNFNLLSDVVAISANDVWAVGESDKVGVHDKSRGLTEHWDGTAWSIVPSPNSSSLDYLVGATAVSTSDIWAVGTEFSGHVPMAFIEHWNGTAWSIVTNPAPANSDLSSIVAISSTDVWAVGDAVQGNSYITLTMHWNGTAWSVVPSPSVPSAGSYLLGVTAISTSDVWAVGQADKNVKIQSFFEHWDGTQWTIVASPTTIIDRPPPRVIDYQLVSIAAASSQMVWSVGVVNNNIKSTQNILIERWDGTQWTIFPNLNITGSLSAVSVLSPNDAWAVGSGQTDTLILHWNGTAWNVVPSPTDSSFTLSGVTQVPATTQAWTVGDSSNSKSGKDKTLTEFYC